MTKSAIACLIFLAAEVWTPAAVGAQDTATPAPPPAPAPYSLPWQLRPAAVGTFVRLDQTLALFENASTKASGHTWVTTLIGARKISPRWAMAGRASLVSHRPSSFGAAGATAFSNLVVGATYAPPPRAPWRASGAFTVALPVGQGGGINPDTAAANAMSAALPARAAMDNAVFAVNYLTLIGGCDLAWVSSGWTVQGEATVFRLLRARGPETQDASRTNFTAGLHLGYFVTSRFTLSGEFRYQRWLSNAAPVRKNPDARETATMGLGARVHVPLGGGHWIRPGVLVSKIIDHPGSLLNYRLVQVDLPVSF